MNKKSIKTLLGGAIGLFAVIVIAYLIYLLGILIVNNGLTKLYVYPFIIDYVYTFAVGLAAVIIVIIVVGIIVESLEEKKSI